MRLALGSGLGRALLVVGGLRLGMGLVAWLTLLAGPVQPGHDEFQVLREAASSPLFPLVGPWQHWDALWYQHLAVDGYRPGGPDAAFFPLYPGIVHGLASVLGDAGLAALLVSTGAFVAALTLIHRLVTDDFDAATARRVVLHIALFPTAFFFLAGYAESLLLTLAVAALLAARRRRWLGAGLAGVLAAACRPTGALVFVPLVAEAVVEMRQRQAVGRVGWRWSHLLALSPLLGLALYTLWAGAALGVPGGSFAAAGYWGQRVAAPWVAIAGSVGSVLTGTHSEELLNLGSVVLLIVALPLMAQRLPASYTAFAAAMLPALCFRTAALTPLMSADRYLIVVFPVFVLLARLEIPGRLRAALLAGSALWLVVLSHDFFRGYFIG